MPRKIHAKDEIEGTQLRRNALAIYEKLVAEDPPQDRNEERALVSRAFAIATSNLQKHGYLEPGSHRQTAKGRQVSLQKALDQAAEQRADAYEAMLGRARKPARTQAAAAPPRRASAVSPKRQAAPPQPMPRQVPRPAPLRQVARLSRADLILRKMPIDLDRLGIGHTDPLPPEPQRRSKRRAA